MASGKDVGPVNSELRIQRTCNRSQHRTLRSVMGWDLAPELVARGGQTIRLQRRMQESGLSHWTGCMAHQAVFARALCLLPSACQVLPAWEISVSRPASCSPRSNIDGRNQPLPEEWFVREHRRLLNVRNLVVTELQFEFAQLSVEIDVRAGDENVLAIASTANLDRAIGRWWL